METLELTQEELELIRERRKTYDVEKVKAEEVIQEKLTGDIERAKSSIFRDLQDCRLELKVNRKLVEDLNKEAGEELFKLGVRYSEEVRRVIRYYYTDENGVRSAISYKSNYSDSDQKYGPEVVKWSKKYKILKSRVEHVKYSSVYLSRGTYTERKGVYYSIYGFGYDIQKRPLKRLSSIITKVKDLVHIQRKTLDNKVFFDQCVEKFKKEMNTVYLPHGDIESVNIYSREGYVKLKNGIEITVGLEVDNANRTYTVGVKYITYPEVKYSVDKDLSTIIQGCRDWKPLEID